MQESQSGGGSQSGTGMSPNMSGALSYVLGLITGVVFLLIDKGSYVRFHAFQSIIFNVALIAFWIVYSIVFGILTMVPVIGVIVGILGFLISMVVGLGSMVLWIVLIIKAAQGEKWKIPYIGDMAEGYASK